MKILEINQEEYFGNIEEVTSHMSEVMVDKGVNYLFTQKKYKIESFVIDDILDEPITELYIYRKYFFSTDIDNPVLTNVTSLYYYDVNKTKTKFDESSLKFYEKNLKEFTQLGGEEIKFIKEIKSK